MFIYHAGVVRGSYPFLFRVDFYERTHHQAEHASLCLRGARMNLCAHYASRSTQRYSSTHRRAPPVLCNAVSVYTFYSLKYTLVYLSDYVAREESFLSIRPYPYPTLALRVGSSSPH